MQCLALARNWLSEIWETDLKRLNKQIWNNKMKSTSLKVVNTILLAASLLCANLILSVNTNAQSSNGNGKGQGSSKKPHKIGKDLQQILSQSNTNGLVDVILQLNSKPSGQLNALLNRNGVRIRAAYKTFSFVTVQMPAAFIDELASFSEVSFVSIDNKIEAMGHISLTIGADSARHQTGTKGISDSADGSGVGIAVIDSGIDANHIAFLGKDGRSRVIANVDFTGENRTDDPYGHGTHVAGIAAGNGRIANGSYTGIAPNANLINLRVLDGNGIGKVSNLLSALDWLMVNRGFFNIRVVNMSLGGLAINSYKNDPVCQAVRRLSDSGVVMVAAAGNNGKNSDGQKQYGSIHSPGNEPSEIGRAHV